MTFWEILAGVATWTGAVTSWTFPLVAWQHHSEKTFLLYSLWKRPGIHCLCQKKKSPAQNAPHKPQGYIDRLLEHSFAHITQTRHNLLIDKL